MTGQALSRHLDDDALIAAHLRAADPDQTAGSAVHLAVCAECRDRAVALGQWLAALTDEAEAEADVAFTPERLKQQRERVLRRLGEAAGLDGPARVLTFPMRHGAPDVPSRWTGRRVVATAAAAGLVIGLAAGSLLSVLPGHRLPRASMPPSVGDARPAAARAPSSDSVSENDEVLLREIDAALTGSRVSEGLRALDAFTPVLVGTRASAR